MRHLFIHNVFSLGLLSAVVSMPPKMPLQPRPTELIGTIEKAIAQAAPRYEAIDIGIPVGALSVTAMSASPNFKCIVGFCQTPTGVRAFRWKEGAFQYLSSHSSVAWGVNNAGKAVGISSPNPNTLSAVVWSSGKTKVLFYDACAHGIDNRGNIYGMFIDPMLFDETGTFMRKRDGSTISPEVDASKVSYFRAANEKQQAVLTLRPRDAEDNKEAEAAVWGNNKLQSLPHLEKG